MEESDDEKGVLFTEPCVPPHGLRPIKRWCRLGISAIAVGDFEWPNAVTTTAGQAVIVTRKEK